jgi:hypothetical protein
MKSRSIAGVAAAAAADDVAGVETAAGVGALAGGVANVGAGATGVGVGLGALADGLAYERVGADGAGSVLVANEPVVDMGAAGGSSERSWRDSSGSTASYALLTATELGFGTAGGAAGVPKSSPSAGASVSASGGGRSSTSVGAVGDAAAGAAVGADFAQRPELDDAPAVGVGMVAGAVAAGVGLAAAAVGEPAGGERMTESFAEEAGGAALPAAAEFAGEA